MTESKGMGVAQLQYKSYPKLVYVARLQWKAFLHNCIRIHVYVHALID